MADDRSTPGSGGAGSPEPPGEVTETGIGSAADEVPTLWDGPRRGTPVPRRRGTDSPPGDSPGGLLPAPGRIGPYHLVRLLGEGGMGEVWLAEQHDPVRRQVALKVIKRGMDTRRVIARFQAERQALAMMDHPAIAKVLEAGETERGRPYFVMEYVRGVPITDYCDRHRLNVDQRLELFRRVCEGVQHAHQKALIHRDLKPSNILVAEQQGQAIPKIIDFGVAKATAQRLTDSTLFTELGHFVGTPEFMSPEQADAGGEDVDTRSDVYSLGAVLYTLLAGALPFEGRELRRQGPEGIRRTLWEVDPVRPSLRVQQHPDPEELAVRRRTDAAGLGRRLSGDLDWIVMRAMEKERSRRYGSPQELSADLGRHLEDLPVEAGPPSTLYRLGKFARRHRTGVVVSALLVLLLVGFTVASSIQATRLARERDEKETARAEAEAVTRFLTDTLKAVDPNRAGHDVTVREVLGDATDRLDASLQVRPAVDARLRLAIGSAYRSLGLYEEAERQLRLSHLAQRHLLGNDHPATLQSLFELGNVAYNQGNYDAAEVLHRETLEARRRVLGPDHPETLLAQGNLALTLYNQGRATGSTDDAIALMEETLAGFRREEGPEAPRTLMMMNNLAAFYHWEDDLDLAEPLYREALAVSERVLGTQHGDTVIARHNLGELYADQGRTELAEPLLLEVVEQKRRVFGADHPSTLYTLQILARLYLDQGRYDGAAPLLAETLAAVEERRGPDHRDVLHLRLRLAAAERMRGRLDTAEELLRAALPKIHAEAAAQDGDRAVARLLAPALHGMACLRAAQGRDAEAVELLRDALAADGEPPALEEPFADPDLAPLRGTPAFDALTAAWSDGTPALRPAS